MTCKDCIHYDACCEIGGKLQEHYMNKCTDVDCKHFMWREEFVKVVRCKDCKYSKLDNEVLLCDYLSCAVLKDWYCWNGDKNK